jgi:hypothetical protein
VYIDADTQWVNSKCLDNILLFASDTGMFAATEPAQTFVASSVIGAVRHHPIAKLYQQVQVVLSTDGRTGAPWERLGPLGISAAMGVADNHASSRHCTQSTTKSTQQQHLHNDTTSTPADVLQDSPGTPGRLTLPQSYYDEDMPAATSFLMTILNSRWGWLILL